jgi:hypothetical protein
LTLNMKIGSWCLCKSSIHLPMKFLLWKWFKISSTKTSVGSIIGWSSMCVKFSSLQLHLLDSCGFWTYWGSIYNERAPIIPLDFSVGEHP